MSTMLDWLPVKQGLASLRPVALELVPDSLQEYERLVQEKEQAQQGVIMIYGMYSHGKSTLINALLGKESALVGASRTTSDVALYPWERGGCTLLDTPGIESMSQDSEKAQKALSESELVAFVVESGAVEAQLVWSELVRLADEGKKVCLIINDFDGYMRQPHNIERLKDSFRTHMQEMAERLGSNIADITTAVPLFFVNAKLAGQAHAAGRQDLLRLSGLPELEENLVRLVSSLSLHDTLNVLQKKLLTLVSACRCQLAQARGETLLAAAEESLADARAARDGARLNILYELDCRLADMRQELYGIYENASSQAEAQQKLESATANLAQSMSEVMKAELQRAGRAIEGACQDFQAILKKYSMSLSFNGEEGAAKGSLFDSMIESLDWSNLLNKVNWEEHLKQGITSVLKTLKELLPSLFAGKGAVTFARWAAAASRVLGAAATVGFALYEVYKGYAEEDKARQQAQRKAQAIADAVSSTQAGIRDAFAAGLDQSLEDLFGCVLTPIEQNVRQLRLQQGIKGEQSKVLDDVEALLRMAE